MKKALFITMAVAAGAALAWSAAPYLRTTQGARVKSMRQPQVRVEAAAETSVAKAPAKAIANTAQLPFECTLGKNDTKYSLFTVLDVNGDGRGWNSTTHAGSYSACMGPNTADFQTADDWLISPGVTLEAGQDYTLSVELCGTTKAEKTADFAIFMGSDVTPEAMSTVLVAKKTYAGATYTKVEKTFQVTDAGTYAIGIHCTTDKAVNTISRAKNFKLVAAEPVVDAPAVGTVTYEPAPKGELKINVVYTAPTKTQSGADLTEISKVDIYNWAKPDAADHVVLTDVTPGREYTLTLPALEGQNNRIRATAYVGETAGDQLETTSFWVGPDNTPLDPVNVRAALSDDFKSVILTWDAPQGEVGEHGGYIDPSALKYYIFDAFGSYYDPAIVEDAVSPCTISFESETDQDFKAFQVTAAVNDYSASLGTFSNVVVTGQPYTAPWHESFTDCYYGNGWMQDLGTTGNMLTGLYYDEELQTNTDAPEGTEPEWLNSHDRDNGFLLMLPYANGDAFGLNSLKVDISGCAKPVFEFHYQGKGSQLEVKVAREEEDFRTVRTIDLQAEPTDGWTLCRIPLDAYKDARYIRIGYLMSAIHNDDTHTWSVPVDNFRVIDLCATDTRITYMNLQPLKAGQASDVLVSVENLGENATAATTVSVLKDGKTEATAEAGALQPDQVRQVKLSVTPTVLDADEVEISGLIVTEGDLVAANNTAGPAKVSVEHSDLPGVEGLQADKPGNNTVALTWTAPDFSALTSPETVLETFDGEDCPDFSATTACGWKFYDRDGAQNYNFLKDYDNPFISATIGFQTFDYIKSGMPESYYPDAMPHSGTRMLVAWSCDITNDNWAVSPELSGNAQTVKFFARSFSIGYPESFEVYYSDEGDTPEDFTEKLEVGGYPEDGKVSEEWTEYSADLPAGAKHFAIRHTGTDTYALYVDDITFEKGAKYPADLAVQAYNVWRDGESAANVAEAAHNDVLGEDGHHSYRVSAAYNYGESRACEPVEVDFAYDALDALEAAGISVSGYDHAVSVTGARGMEVSVVAADGRLLYRGTAGDLLRVPAAPGVYIVTAGTRSLKAVIR